MTLSDEIKKRRALGWTDYEIKRDLMKYGYNPSMIDQGLIKKPKLKNSNKEIILGVIAGLILIGAIIFIIAILLPKGPTYSDDPKDWIDVDGDINKIDIDEVTDGDAYLRNSWIRYKNEDYNDFFFHSGFYLGNVFEYYFCNSTTYKDEIENNPNTLSSIERDNIYIKNCKMIIRSKLDPNNQVIEGFIAPKIDGETITFYIFTDQQWKDYVGDSYIFWGESYEHNKTYDYNVVSEGIYMDKLEFDFNVFKEYKELLLANNNPLLDDLSESILMFIWI
ncbi:hypothetical protein ACFL1H_00190 [Nanoarchaeota archaeon]